MGSDTNYKITAAADDIELVGIEVSRATTDRVRDVIGFAEKLTIKTPEDAAAAADFLARCAREKKDSEAERVEIVQPIKQAAKKIDERFKAVIAPVEQADGIVRAKLVEYEELAERQRAEEQARIDAEREAQEQAAAEEQARLDAEAEAARKAAEVVPEAEHEPTSEDEDFEGKLDADLAKIIRDDPESPLAKAAVKELADRAARAAEEAAESGAPVLAPPTQLAPTGTRRAASGSTNTTRRWVGEVENPDEVEDRFKVIDQKLINKAIQAGERDIPGVRVYQKMGVAVKAR